MSDYDYDTSDYDDEDTDYTDSDDYNDCDSDYDNSEYTDNLDGVDRFELWESDNIEYDLDKEDLDPSDDYDGTGAWEVSDTENEVDDDTAENLSEVTTEEDYADIKSDCNDKSDIGNGELTEEIHNESADSVTADVDDITDEAEKTDDVALSECIEDTVKETDDNTDWSRTSLRPEEEALLNEMEENSEIEFLEENPDLADPEHTALHLPSEKTGDFSGERGNSEFRPLDEEALSKMNEYGKDFVDYKNNYPDFSPFAEHDSKWGKINGQVEIGHMTDNRQNGAWEYGRRPDGTSHDPDYDIGNFAQADNAIAEELRNEFPDIKGEDIEAFRTASQLVWHECADGKTMQLIPIEIHDACKHSGGVSEMKYRMAWGDVTKQV